MGAKCAPRWPRRWFVMPGVFLLAFSGMSCTFANCSDDWEARKSWLAWRLNAAIEMLVYYPTKWGGPKAPLS